MGAMVGWMTYGLRKFEKLDMQMRVLIKNLDELMRDMIPMIDRDTNAFNAYMDAMKLPKKTPEEIERREGAMQEGLKTAVQVPLQGMRTACKAWPFMTEMAKIGNIKSMSDLQVGAKCLETGIWGCYQNVLINLGDVKDEAFKTEVLAECEKLMEQSEKEQKAKRRYELKVLQSQINPHFLYNTLDSIIWMAEWGKNQEVVKMTSSLARLLRRSISNEQEVVTIEEEIDYTEAYLTIQKMRYQDKLEYEIEAEPDIRKEETVKLVLQPVVENAIYHGIKYKEGKGLIQIRGFREGGDIILQVEDDGRGMDQDTLEHIFEKHVRDTKSNGVGLQNVHERIRLYYGAAYGLSFESEPGKGTVVTIRLPGGKGEADEQKEN